MSVSVSAASGGRPPWSGSVALAGPVASAPPPPTGPSARSGGVGVLARSLALVAAEPTFGQRSNAAYAAGSPSPSFISCSAATRSSTHSCTTLLGGVTTS